jgi:hypothetical protein
MRRICNVEIRDLSGKRKGRVRASGASVLNTIHTACVV